MRSRVETIALVLVGAFTLTSACATVGSSEPRPPAANLAQPACERACQMVAGPDHAAELARAARLFSRSARALVELRGQHCPRTGAHFCAALDRKIAELMAIAEDAMTRCRAASPSADKARCWEPARRRVMVIAPAGG